MLFPTDTKYALGCVYSNKKGIQRVRKIKGIDESHLLTLLCDSLAGIAKFAIMEDDVFKIIKKLIPGPFTFVLPATKEVPRLLLNPKRNTIGFRVPDYPIVQKIVEEMGEPLIATTAGMNHDERDAPVFREDLLQMFDKLVDLIIDNQQEINDFESTVIDLTEGEAVFLRKGLDYERALEAFKSLNFSFVD